MAHVAGLRAVKGLVPALEGPLKAPRRPVGARLVGVGSPVSICTLIISDLGIFGSLLRTPLYVLVI